MRKYIIVLVILLLIIKLYELREPEKIFQFNHELVNLLQTGDLVLIAGDSYKSEFVKVTDTYSNNYSHIGFIVKENDCITNIVHMSIDSGYIEWENLEDYVNKSKLLNIDFYRLNNKISSDEICKILEELNLKKIEFDYSFNHKEADKLYCSELIMTVLDMLGYKLQLNKQKQYIYPSEFTKESISYKICLTN